jgi:hypothetical protein
MRVRPTLALIALGLLAYSVFLALTMPAAVAWELMDEQVPVEVYGPAGTVWHGGADALVAGPRRIDALRWRLHPLSLLALSPAADVSGSFTTGGGEARVRIRPDGTLVLSDVRAQTSFDTVLAWIQRGALQPFADGRVELLMPHGVVRNGLLQQAEGLLTWSDAAVGVGGQVALGDLALRLRPAEPDGTVGVLTARNGPLRVDGRLELSPSGDFRLEARVRAADPGSPQARRLSSLLGLANPDGTTVITATGNVDGSDLQLRQRAE